MAIENMALLIHVLLSVHACPDLNTNAILTNQTTSVWPFTARLVCPDEKLFRTGAPEIVVECQDMGHWSYTDLWCYGKYFPLERLLENHKRML